jgi:hypothetical protein
MIVSATPVTIEENTRFASEVSEIIGRNCTRDQMKCEDVRELLQKGKVQNVSCW